MKKKIENKDEGIKEMERYKKKDEVIKNDKLKGRGIKKCCIVRECPHFGCTSCL
jgi:hypothetical protein